MKVFHLPNERTTERLKMELTSRTAFENLLKAGEISEYFVYSFLYEMSTKSISCVENEILDIVSKMQPDIIFWQHVSDFNPSQGFYKKIKDLSTNSKLVYQDEDPYGTLIKPVTKEMERIIRVSDLSLTSGTGKFIDRYYAKGARKALYFPHCFDSERTPPNWSPNQVRDIPVVMIGSMFHSKIPGRLLPGALKRLNLAKQMDKRIGTDFFLYGKGWDKYNLVSARGLLPFDQQFSTLKNSWISINWDHFDTEPCYSSDRLPISMASGTPHITNWHPGYDLMFKGCEGGVYFAKSPKEAVEIATYLLSQPKEFLIDEGRKAFEFVYKNYESTVVYKKLIDFLKMR